MGKELEARDSYEAGYEVLANNTFGFLEGEGTQEEKVMRLLGLLPMAFNVVDEARETITRLRDENEELRERLQDGRMDTL